MKRAAEIFMWIVAAIVVVFLWILAVLSFKCNNF